MAFRSFDTLDKHGCIGVGGYAYIYLVSPTIVVKTLSTSAATGARISWNASLRFPTISSSHSAQTRHSSTASMSARSEKITISLADLSVLRIMRTPHLLPGGYNSSLTSALEYVEKMGFCHNDLNTSNCLLDQGLNLKLSDFRRATTIGHLLEHSRAPWAMQLAAGPLQGTYGLCSARTEQFAVGSLLYYMVYGHKPYEDVNLDWPGLETRFEQMKFPELNRHEVFDGLILGCWYNVYPTMALVAYDFKRKTKDFASTMEYETTDGLKETKTCEALVRKGILGPELALSYQPLWQKYLHALKSSTFVWHYLVGLPRRIWFWAWFLNLGFGCRKGFGQP
ncbi:TKL protein kinase [Trichophyton equinum CBS 127.97]|uniref:TKL protein kinase n=1 Tax=Trichophyton equinum (strain ATCC MYA-4606 / CBS 127.97) TaxID=559882 RepID=F2PH40_TRIEC|nr:TKL protein kinase [Trichophyton equinum CBS 127.97]